MRKARGIRTASRRARRTQTSRMMKTSVSEIGGLHLPDACCVMLVACSGMLTGNLEI